MRSIGRISEMIDIDFARNVFLVLSGLVFFAVLIDAGVVYLKKPKLLSAQSVETVLYPPLESEEVYLNAFSQSTLFGSTGSSDPTAHLVAAPAELVKDYRLRGVVLGSDPEAIVEDARTQKTEFVKMGSSVGQLRVKEIKEGFIVLECLSGEARLEIK